MSSGRWKPSAASNICFDWARTGNCRFGSRCKFEHRHQSTSSTGFNNSRSNSKKSAKGGGNQSKQTQKQGASARDKDSERYVKHLSTLRPAKLASELESSTTLWYRAWKLHATFDHHTLSCLVESLAKIPGSSSIDAPPSNLCKDIILKFLEKSKQSDEKILKASEIVQNCVVRLLQFEWEEPREAVCEALTDILLSAEAILRKQNKDHRLMSQSLLKHLEDLERPWRIQLKETLTFDDIVPQEDVETKEASFDSWKNGTVAWLSTPEFFAPSLLPVMKVPGTSSNGVYGSKEEYIETVYRLWVGMTFVDGHSSVSARCLSRCNKGPCQLTLWPISKNHAVSKMSCKTFHCSEPVVLACRMKGHDALCLKCTVKAQSCMRGAPGPKASTHIYDGEIAKFDADGNLFVQEVKSRNPPQHDIHWRSTKRLSCPSLVAIVKLSSSGGALKLHDTLHWGELSFHSKPQDEHFRRVDGEVKVDMTSICDNVHVNFQPGDPVCIIDCMVFCPEWIPVLQALEKNSKLPLPFNDGQLLNLCSSKPPDISNCIVYNGDESVIKLGDIPSLVDTMIQDSRIDPIRAIRQHPQSRNDLVGSLAKLLRSATLDRMQLISFLDGMKNPVHLTQGPPGTGKSYLGVVMVRALLIIRDIWLKVSPSIGTPPILVLSYKNHAIDEFLNDLVASMPRRSLYNKLIRIGGQCKDTRLEPYSERYACRSDVEVNKKKKILENLHNMRSRIQQLIAKGRLFQSYRVDIFGADDVENSQSGEMKRRKALNEATKVALESLSRVKHLVSNLEQLEDISPISVYNSLSFSLLNIDGGAVSTKEINALIKKLVKDVEHYHFPHPGDLICEWLRGLKPLSKCSFVIEKNGGIECKNLSLTQFPKLCVDHQCRCIMNENRCFNAVQDHGTIFCVEHLCQADDCEDCRVNIEQKFCQLHCCKKCLELGAVSNQANDDPPRNVCDQHPLCCSLDCLNYPEQNNFFCEEHQSQVCKAITKRGNKCTNKCISRSVPYCRDHINKQPIVTTEISTVPVLKNYSSVYKPNKCSAITKKGKPCKGWASTGEEFCNDHLPLVLASEEKAAIPPENLSLSRSMKATFDSKAEQSVDTNKEVNMQTLEYALKKKLCLPVKNTNISVDSAALDNSQTVLDTKEEKQENDINPISAHCESTTSDNKIGDNICSNDDDMEDEAEYMKHLRDVFEVREDEEDDDSFCSAVEDSINEIDILDEPTENEIPIYEPENWEWSMTLDERWNQCQSLMNHEHKILITALDVVSKAIIRGRGDLKSAKIRANAKVYENRSVIGGTMVGCIARLDAIRSTNPFAIIVEEASEVLEPLLFSCLCNSTCKLEMIGDHLQLQPSTMNRFDFEIVNKTNVSMFQRLIQAPFDSQVPSAVLSTQRRMRTEICDLTRSYYKDIITIEDHPLTKTQRIGAKEKLPTSLVEKTLTQGREIPGISPNIYLWTHSGKQGKARVGLSRVNENEADMICSLACYLVNIGGVPKRSIAILTPYKGQLMLIREKLFKDQRYKSPQLISRDSKDSNTCRLSTVDRFQGDESDIVLISLVVDNESRTPFVRLVNRMIVLLSRARLGMYIIGNVGYFEDNRQGLSPHWSKLLQDLKNCQSNCEEYEYPKPRVGEEIPICCPIHREHVKMIKNPEELKGGFCSIICNELLTCGHPCANTCHWPKLEHNKKCTVMLESPCTFHSENISCMDLYTNSTHVKTNRTMKNEEIRQFYRCPKKVTYLHPCGHKEMLPCWQNQEILNKNETPPKCKKQSPTPFLYKSCKHTLNVTCSEYDRYNASPDRAPSCAEEVKYIPTCGHVVDKMPCHKAQLFYQNENSFRCHESVSLKLPRCCHNAKVHCTIAEQLKAWEGRKCDVVGEVHQGVNYGPKDYPCKETVSFVKNCGHREVMKCEHAFLMSTTKSALCKELVKTQNRYCGHAFEVFCHEEKKMNHLPIPNTTDEFFEGSIAPFPPSITRRKKCHIDVVIHRKCGHDFHCKCGSIHEPLPDCRESLAIASPLCNHNISVPCFMKDALKVQIWNDTDFTLMKDEKKLNLSDSATIKSSLSSLSQDQRSILSTCQESLTFTLGCGHDIEIPCSKLIFLLSNPSLLRCKENIFKPLKCRHIHQDECWRFQSYEEGKSQLKCNVEITHDCWNVANCGNKLPTLCGYDISSGVLACNWPTSWRCQSGKHSFEINQCTKGVPQSCPLCEESIFERETNALGPIQSHTDRFFQLTKRGGVEVEDATELNLKSKLGEFERSEQTIVDNFKDYQQKIPLLERQISKVRRFPVFKVIGKKAVRKIRPSMLGMDFDILNEHNIELLKNSQNAKKLSLLLAFASSIRVYVHKGEVPYMLKQKKKRALIEKIQKEGFDSIVYKDTRRGGFECLLSQDPFPIIQCRLITGTIDEVVEVLSTIPTHSAFDFKPLDIKFLKHKGRMKKIQKIAFDTCKPLGTTINMSDDQNEELSKVLKGTQFDTLRPCPQEHYSREDPLGIACFDLNEKVIEDLRNKMTVINPEALPFQGINVLETLKAQGLQSNLLLLCLSLESTSIDKKDSSNYLEDYLEQCNGIFHPFALLAASRSLVNPSRNLLKAFDILFSDAKKYLSKDELLLLQNEDSVADEEDKANSILESWEELKEEFPQDANSDAMEKLLALTGLFRVKKEAFELYKSSLHLRQLSKEIQDANKLSANFCFLGNPGTGKTTVARLFAQILEDAGLRQNSTFVETTAQTCKDGGMDEFKKSIQSAMGGVLFIDEAYDLDPVSDFKGKPIVNEILTLSENKRDEISIILAGYEDDFNKKFFAYNDGLRSRFHNILFEDFNEAELSKIWNDMREGKMWEEQEKVCSVLIRRLVRSAGRKGFGNAREIRKRLETAIKRAMTRLGSDIRRDNMILKISDVIGENPLLNEKIRQVMDAVNEKIGWVNIKKAFEELIQLCGTNYSREIDGLPPLEVFFNRMFLGNPGTGKTTCGKLYGQLLKHLGFLSIGDVVVKTASDFIGQHVGESQTKTNTILDGAKGKVLLIDEAYALDDKLWGKQVLDTLVEKVQGTPGDDIAVLLLGYEEPMLSMLRNQNPGLMRRFPKDYAFCFDDYDDNQLLMILKINLDKMKISASTKFQRKALEILQSQREQLNFGNAGAVELLLKSATQKMAQRESSMRLEESDLDELCKNDFDDDSDPLELLDNLYKMGGVKRKLEELRDAFIVAKREGEEKPDVGHFVFTGSPGTGKTTVARSIAKILHGLGLIPTHKIVETSGLDLTGDFVGHTKTKVTEILREAKGGILFIDEAYNIGFGPYGKEACDTIVAAMTSEEYKDLVVVIAGYETDINKMLNGNAGLKSRFTQYFNFPDWDSSDCIKFFTSLATKNKFSLDAGVLDELRAQISTLIGFEGWGNGRDIMRIWKSSLTHRASRIAKNSADFNRTLAKDDVAKAIKELIIARKPKKHNLVGAGGEWSNLPGGTHFHTMQEDNSQNKPKFTQGSNNLSNKDNDHEMGQEEEEEVNSPDETEPVLSEKDVGPSRDEGVPDEIWDELQRSKQKEKEEEELLNRQHDEYISFLREKEEEEKLAKIAFEKEMERIRMELEEAELLEAERKLLEEEERRKELIRQEKKRREEEERKRMEKIRENQRIQEKLQRLRPCPYGFNWHRCGGGWRCAGGSHFVSEAELRKSFTI